MRRPAGATAALAAGLGAAVLLGACTVAVSGSGHPVGSGGPSGPSTPTGPASCPSAYAAPDPNRPVIELKFTVADDLSTVTGTEHVVFRPDKDIDELVFRLTANTAPTVAAGNSITVTSARADHGAQGAKYTRSGAADSTQGGLLHIPFASPVRAGTAVTADLAFTLKLGNESFDRFGRVRDGADRYAWFASAQPLLAWQRGFGWHSEDLIKFTAESATSEAADTTLTVLAPADRTVITSGDAVRQSRAGRQAVWRAHNATARDVSVAVGPFKLRDTKVGGVTLRVGAPDQGTADDLTDEFQRAISQLSKRFGPFPFPSLSVARVPAGGGGIEYPGSILMLDGSRLVAVHETAHQWFYAMVGDSQALHPWLDEAFASYAEQLVDGGADPSAADLPGRVDSSTESYGDAEGAYYRTTYDKGAGALHAARAAAGADAFDRALRCYVNANAWRIAVPQDLAAALARLPKAIAVLTKAGALP